MQKMAAALGAHPAENRHSQQRQIANDVQNLMAHELVRKPQARFIQHAVLCQYDRIVERAAPNQVSFPQSFDFFDESKSARRSNIAGERSVIQSKRTMLNADQRVGKVDGAIYLITVGR